jgi:putative redox protein
MPRRFLVSNCQTALCPTHPEYRMSDKFGSPVVSASIGAEDFQVALSDGTHEWLGDEPASHGGADTGPTPHGLLLSSLGACTTITLKMYAKHKGWPLQAVHVTLTYQSTPPEATVIDRQIKLTGELDSTQRERLLQIANACPVHKILSGSIAINSGLTPL